MMSPHSTNSDYSRTNRFLCIKVPFLSLFLCTMGYLFFLILYVLRTGITAELWPLSLQALVILITAFYSCFFWNKFYSFSTSPHFSFTPKPLHICLLYVLPSAAIRSHTVNFSRDFPTWRPKEAKCNLRICCANRF